MSVIPQGPPGPAGPPGPSGPGSTNDLATTLGYGNTSGAYDISMGSGGTKKGITNANTIDVDTLQVDTIQPGDGSLSAIVQLEANLNIKEGVTPGVGVIDFTLCDGVIGVGAGHTLALSGLTSAAQANVVGIDTATGKLYSQAVAATGVTSITAGRNITVDNTDPAVPVIALTNPLTDLIAAGENQIGGSSTAGTETSSWSNEAGYGGSSALNLLNYTNTAPVSGKIIDTILETTSNASKITSSYNDVTNGSTTSGILETTSGIVTYTDSYVDPANSIIIRREDKLNGGGGFIKDICQAADGISGSSATRTEETNLVSGVTNSFSSTSGTGEGTTAELSAAPSAVNDTKQYSNPPLNKQSSSGITCDVTESTHRVQYSDTNFGTPILHTQNMSARLAGPILQQDYSDIALNRTSVIQTTNAGLDINGDNAVAISAVTSLDLTTPVLTIDGIANATAVNTLYYDATSKAVTYGALPSAVTSITAGRNITVDNTIPSAPVIALTNPLSSSIAAGTNQIGGSTATGTETSSWSNKAGFGGSYVGSYALNLLNYTDTDPVSEKIVDTKLETTYNESRVTTSYNYVATGTTATGILETGAGTSAYIASYVDPVNSITISREDKVDGTGGGGGIIRDIHSVNDAINSRSTTRTDEITILSGISDSTSSIDNTGQTSTTQFQVAPTSVLDIKNYNNPPLNKQSTSDIRCDVTESRHRVRYSDTNTGTIINTQDMSAKLAGPILQQVYSNAGVNRTSVIQTTSAGLDINGDNAVAISATASLDLTTPVLTIDGIANATAVNTLYYDDTTKAVTYGAAPSGGGVVSIVAGDNITVDSTDPANPVVALSYPLTASIEADTNTIGGTAAAGTETANWSNQVLDPTNATQTVTYTDSDVAAEKQIRSSMEVTSAASDILTEYYNITDDILATAKLQSQSNQTLYTASITDTPNNITIASSDTLNINSVIRACGADNGTVTTSRNETTDYTAGVNETLSYTTTALDNKQIRLTQATTVSDSKQYKNVGATTITTTADNVCDGTKSSYIIQYADSGPTPSITNSQTMVTNAGTTSLQQSYNNSSFGAAKTTVLNTTSTGTTLTASDTFTINAAGSQTGITCQTSGITLTGNAENFNTTVNAGTGAPSHIFNNSNISPASHVTLRTINTGHNATGANDFIYQQVHTGRNNAGGQIDFARIDVTCRGAAALNEKAVMSMYCYNNTGATKILELNTVDGGGGKITASQAIDTQTFGIKSSNGNCLLDASASTGPGLVWLATKNGVAGAGTGLVLSGNTLLSASAGGSSGQHLALTINGTVYKIALLSA